MTCELLLLRHGETEWSRNGRHTGRTDLPLLESGRAQALALAPLLAPLKFARVLASPLRRARETAELAGLHAIACDSDLMEWDYGSNEGLTTAQIRARHPDWDLWREGCPGGETSAEVGARCDRVLSKVADDEGLVVLVAHGHVLRVLVARWLSLAPAFGKHWVLSPASLTHLGHEHENRVITGLNRGTP